MKKIIITERIRQLIDFDLVSGAEEIEMTTAYSNEDALSSHRGNRADLIITELYGSGMNAVRFCAQIRESPDLCRVSVIVFCRDNEIELREAGRSRANAVLTLPVAPALLRHAVQQLLTIPARGEYHARFSARCARYSLQKEFECEVENISVTGMLIEANAELSAGDRINCSLALLPAGSFPVQGEVVRSVKSREQDRARYGVRFSRIDPAARRAIETIVRQHA